MQSVAKKLSQSAIYEQRAVVVALDPSALVVESDTGRYRAKRAVSCLVEPEEGDLVLVACGEDGTSHVLAVLERQKASASVISAPGDVVVRSHAGKVQIAGSEGVDLVTPKEANVVANAVSIHAERGNLVVDAMSAVGSLFHADIDKVKLVAKSLDHVLDRLTQRVKASYRTVLELDRKRAKNVDHVAEGTMKVHARETVMTADALVKMDAEQIHMG
ncbi:MAG: DUF3540 domain-containing protein [Polyangiaceae bacterium]|nr:DUF3540 domain-containing protein [Polyangiaceae bacterium]